MQARLSSTYSIQCKINIARDVANNLVNVGFHFLN